MTVKKNLITIKVLLFEGVGCCAFVEEEDFRACLSESHIRMSALPAAAKINVRI